MPFDILPSPTATRPIRTATSRAVALWLLLLAAMILVMVTLGGVTRLTGSGLSIMEWAPIMGTLPPLTNAEWNRLYALYQQIPQYSLVNQGFGLEGFKSIFWLEWAHRLWGRLMGLAFALPLAWFLWRRQIDRPLAGRLTALLLMGGLQGAVGWVMVASGFEADRLAVSPYRLVAHLALAVGLYAAILWTALGVWQQSSPPRTPSPRALPAAAMPIVCSLIALTILAGGFVAGLKAGLTYNSFPFMDGNLIPNGYSSLQPAYLNLFENTAAVQFDHRLLATLTALVTLAVAASGLRHATGGLRPALLALAAAVMLQYGLGILTLLWAVPPTLGAAHQAMAMLVLTAALVSTHLLLPLKPRAPAP